MVEQCVGPAYDSYATNQNGELVVPKNGESLFSAPPSTQFSETEQAAATPPLRSQPDLLEFIEQMPDFWARRETASSISVQEPQSIPNCRTVKRPLWTEADLRGAT